MSRDLAKNADSKVGSRGRSVLVVNPEERVANGYAADAGEFVRIAHRHAGVELRVSSHEARSRAKIEDIGVWVEEYMALAPGKAKVRAIVLSHFEPGLGAGVKA